MSELIPQLHPLADSVSVIDTSLQNGLADELPYWAFVNGYDTSYVPNDFSADGTSLLMLEHLSGAAKIEYQFAPKEESNPMRVLEGSEDEIRTIPVIARLFVSSQVALYKVGVRGNLPITSSSIQVDVTLEGAVISFSDGANINPVAGEFDGDIYRFIQSRSNLDLRLDLVKQMAEDYLAA